MNINIANLAKKAASVTDMTQATAGGGDYTPPAAGNCRLRLIGYIEHGIHPVKRKGVEKDEDQVELIFEVSGPKHPAVDGKFQRVSTGRLARSLNEKANFFKLFTKMNYDKAAKHFVELLDKPFKGVIHHDKWTGTDGKERVSAVLRDESGSWTIAAPFREDEDGEMVRMEVAERTNELRVFLWDLCDKAQWDSLFIDGVRDDGTTKNKLQESIKAAKNYPGSPIAQLLGDGDTLPDEELAKHVGADSEDPLA